ncbi:MAG: hypothetical protein KTR16_14680 [Acidiferrobacterales bacterium]|nr:hypothetical protein [Acidiferrobacterales bacterium]
MVKVFWRNQQVRFTLRTVDAEGVSQLRKIEPNTIYYLERAGVDKSRLSVADSVTK